MRASSEGVPVVSATERSAANVGIGLWKGVGMWPWLGQRVTAVLVNDIVLLVAVVYHALNGLRRVVLDWGLSNVAGRRVFDVVLWLVGIFSIAYGIWALWAWVS